MPQKGLNIIVKQRSRSGVGTQVLRRRSVGVWNSDSPNPASPQTDLERALAAHQTGQWHRAETLYRKVLARSPDSADALHLLGTLLLEQGQIPRAIALIRKAILILPDFPQAYNNLGNALRLAGCDQEAEKNYHMALTLQPTFAIANNNLGRLHNDQGRFDLAVAACGAGMSSDPTLAELHWNCGIAYRGLGQLARAVKCYREALRLKPDDLKMIAALSMVLLELDRFSDANSLMRDAFGRHPDDPHLGLAMAALKRHEGRIADAISLLRQVVARDPSCAEGWSSLGGALCARGQLTEATACCEKAISLDPALASAYRRLAQTSQNSNRGSEIASLARLLDTKRLALPDQIHLGFALGKMLDDADRYDAAFARFHAANNLVASLLEQSGRAFDHARLDRLVDRIIQDGFDRGGATPSLGGSAIPVFIVGMPRSGTSLIEQIIASHSAAAGVGESTDIGQLAGQLNGGAVEPDWSQRAAQWYLARLEAAAPGKMRVVDKMPDNMFHLGPLPASFPPAKIIVTRRNPMDTGLSCYFQHFTNHKQNFSYRLEDCAHRYRAVERLISYWRQVLPGSIHQICYETLIDDPEPEIRLLINFLDLGWEDACLDFHRTDRNVTTASSWQVRQPLYRRSVGKWQHYQHHLAPMLEVLRVENAG